MTVVTVAAGRTVFALACLLLASPTFAADLVPLKAPSQAGASSFWTSASLPMFGDFEMLQQHISATRGAFKIAENESVRPTDRVFATYNYFNNVQQGPSFGRQDVHRGTLGFEKTFLDNSASFGVRIPFFNNLMGESDTVMGDVSLITKYALFNDPGTGNVITAGLSVTLPNGQYPHRFDSLSNQNIHSTMFQPFVGWVFNYGDFFIKGFHSVMIPSDSKDASFLFNDIGVGYWLYRAPRNQGLTAVIPTIEVHVNTPLNHSIDNTQFDDRNVVNLTLGTYFQFNNRYLVGVAVGVPLTGPHPYDVEAIATLNVKF